MAALDHSRAAVSFDRVGCGDVGTDTFSTNSLFLVVGLRRGGEAGIHGESVGLVYMSLDGRLTWVLRFIGGRHHPAAFNPVASG